MESGKSLEKNISGANLDLVRTAKLVLDEYFSLTGEGAAGQQVKTFPEASRACPHPRFAGAPSQPFLPLGCRGLFHWLIVQFTTCAG